MKARVHRWGQFLQLGRADQRTLMAGIFGLPLLWLGLSTMGLPKMQALVQASNRRAPKMRLQDMQALAALVALASRHTLGPTTCLTRSLMLAWLLKRRGVPGQLRIGVRLDEGRLDAHAWVEVEGVPVNDEANIASRFLPFDDLVPLHAFGTK